MAKRSGLSSMMILLMVLATMGPAVGGPDIDCNARPDHPHCQDPGPLPDHPDGGTCEASGDAWIAATDDFSVEFTDKLLCVDWTTTKEATWRITIRPDGSKLSAFATVRDSHPGDWCWRADGGWDITPDGGALTAVMDGIPIASVDACGLEYSDVADPPEDAIPLVLTIGYKWRSSGVVVTVEEVP